MIKIGLGIGLVVALAVSLKTYLNVYNLDASYAFIVPIIITTVLSSFYVSLLYSQRDHVRANVVASAVTGGTLAFAYVLTLLFEDPVITLAGMLGARCAGAIVLRRMFLRLVFSHLTPVQTIKSIRESDSEYRKIITISLPILGLGVLSSVNGQLDKIFISQAFPGPLFSSYVAVGALLQVVVLAGLPVVNSMFARLSGSPVEDAADLSDRLKVFAKMIRWSLGLSSVAAACFLLFKAPVFSMLGSDWKVSESVYIKLLCMNYLYALQTPFFYYQLARTSGSFLRGLSFSTLFGLIFIFSLHEFFLFSLETFLNLINVLNSLLTVLMVSAARVGSVNKAPYSRLVTVGAIFVAALSVAS